jgi:hypothetical protein
MLMYLLIRLAYLHKDVLITRFHYSPTLNHLISGLTGYPVNRRLKWIHSSRRCCKKISSGKAQVPTPLLPYLSGKKMAPGDFV